MKTPEPTGAASTMPKFFRVATEGPTIDGRHISGAQLQQAAANYDPDKYGARIWVEHLRSFMPDSSFGAYGDVEALKTSTNSDGETILLAQLSPTDDLKALNKKSQKVYSSIELNSDFRGSGQAYLMGLAVTDTPASVGTERLHFSAAKEHPDKLYSAYIDAELSFDDDPDHSDSEQQKFNLLDRIRSLISSNSQAKDEQYNTAMGALADELEQGIGELLNDFNDRDQRQAKTITDLQAEVTQLASQLSALTQQLDQTPSNQNHSHRPTADGSASDDSQHLTDC